MTTPEAEVSIEDVRAYWDRRPCNVRHSKSPVGTKEYFDEVEWRKYFVEPHIPAFASFDRWKGKSVLDLGCGIGTMTTSFARAGARVTAVDLSGESLKIAEQRASVFGLTDRITFIQGNAEDVDSLLRGSRFDLVFSFGVIHHTPQPERAVAAIRTLMDEQSQLRMMVYATHSWKNIMISAGLDQPEAQVGCPLATTYTDEEVRQLLRGFRVLSLQQDHIFPFVVEKYINHEYELTPWFAAMPKPMFRALERQLGWHLLVTATLPT